MALKDVLSPFPGRPVALSEVTDPVFSQGMVGRGAAVEPPPEVVTALAPITGKVVQLLPHAFAIQDADEFGVLVHLGMDTVNLQGVGFACHVAKNAEVVAGQPIISFDVPAAIAAGLSPVSPVVATEVFEECDIVPGAHLASGAAISAGQLLFSAQV